MWRGAVTAVLSLAAGAAAAVWMAGRWSAPEESGWTRLANGLRFRVERVEDAKDVAVLTAFGIGSDHDPKGRSGLAHLVEHLFVTCAAGSRPARTAEEWSSRYGGQCYAITGYEQTGYGVTVPVASLADEIADVAARLTDLRIEPSDFDRERPRVEEQITEGDGMRSALGEAMRLARGTIRPTPNSAPPFGVADHVAKLRLDDVRDRWRRYYRGANVRLVVAGEVDMAATRALLARAFASVPPGERPPAEAPWNAEPKVLRLEDDRGPQPGLEPRRVICIAYPYARRGADDDAAIFALTVRAMPDTPTSRSCIVLADDDVLYAFYFTDDRTIEETTQEFDRLVEDSCRRSLTESERELMRSASAANATTPPPGGPVDPMIIAADFLRRNSMVSLSKLAELAGQLTSDELHAWAARWHVADRRVVVEYRGWVGHPAAPPPRPAAREHAPNLDPIPEVCVTVSWDEAAQTLHRRIGGREYAKDDDLQRAIAEAHDAWVKKGRPDAPVTIDADPRIPWNEVITVVNLIKRCGIEKIEFAMGAAPKRPQPPK